MRHQQKYHNFLFYVLRKNSARRWLSIAILFFFIFTTIIPRITEKCYPVSYEVSVRLWRRGGVDSYVDVTADDKTSGAPVKDHAEIHLNATERNPDVLGLKVRNVL